MLLAFFAFSVLLWSLITAGLSAPAARAQGGADQTVYSDSLQNGWQRYG